MKESSPDGAALDRTAGESGSRDPLDQVTDLDVAALSSRAGVFRGTASEGIVRTNERFAEITGLPANVRGWDWLVSVHAEDRDRLRRAVEAACESGARSAFPIRMQVQLGRIEALRVEITGTAGADGSFVFVGSVIEDGRTARLPAARPVPTDVDDPFRVLVDALPVGVAYAAPDGRLDFANARWESLTAIGTGSDLGAAFTDARDRAFVADALRTGEPRAGVVRVSGRPVGVSIAPVAPELGGGGVLSLTEPAAGETAAPVADAPVAAFAALLDASLDYAAIIERDGPLRYLNPAARRLFDLADDADLDGVELADFVAFLDDDRPEFRESARQAVRNSGVHVADGEVLLANGERRRVSMILLALTDGDGRHRATVCVARDGTDLHEAEQRVDHATRARDASEAALRTVVRSAPAAIFAVDRAGAIQLWNPASEELFGWTAAEVAGRRVPFLSPGQTERARARSAVLLDGHEISGEMRFRHRDGHPIIAAVSAAPVHGADGEVAEIVVVAVDVTDRVRSDRELERRAEFDRIVASLCRDLVEAAPESLDAQVVAGLEHLSVHFGAQAAALHVRDLETARFCWPAGTDIHVDPQRVPAGGVFAFDDDRPRAGWVIAGASGALGMLVLAWDEPPEVATVDLAPLETLGAALIGAIDRVGAERAVHESDQRFRALAEYSTDFVVVIGGDLQLQYVSPAAARFLGMRVGERFDPTDSVLHPDDQVHVTEEMAAILADPDARAIPMLIRLRRADGEYRWVELAASNLLSEPTIRGLVLNGRDVTEQREVDDRLRASESRFRGLVQNLAEGVTVLAADGSVKYSSPSASRMMGFELGHGTGKIGLDFVVEEDRERAAEIVGRAFTEPGIQGPIALRIRAANGEVRVVEALGHNRLDDPEVEGIVITTRDITERIEAEEAVRRSDARLSALVQNLSDVITVVDPQGDIVYTSPAAKELFGFVEGDASYVDPLGRVHPDERDAVTAAFGEQLAGSSIEPVRFRLEAADGGWHHVEAVARDMTDEPSVGGIVVTTRDVTGRTRAELLVADQARVLTLIARGAPLPVTLAALCEVLERHVRGAVCGALLVDRYRQILRLAAGPRVPGALADACHDVPITGTEDVLGATVSQGVSAVVLDVPHDPRTVGLRDVAAQCGIGGVWTTPIDNSDGSGVLGAVVTFLDDAREPSPGEREVVQMFAQTAAIAIERQASEDLLAHRANHDLLTGLPNRGLFVDFLGNALARSERDGAGIAVLFLDVDRFKHVNDGLGHDAGDELLREIAHRLKQTVRPSDVVARFGGDEFTVLCAGLDATQAEEQASQLARRLLEAIERPLQLDGDDRRLSASLGIAMAGPGSTPEGLLHDADAAMYEAKQRGKARVEMFDDSMRSALNARLDLEARLERAIEHEEFRLVVQPIVDLSTGHCVAAEALLRWQDPELGLVTPDAFIGLAEDTGLIIPIGEWALAEACRTVARWEEIGLMSPEFTMAVNLSARQVGQADLVDRVRTVIERSGPTASRLCLEITESVLMEESSVAAMLALKSLGVRLSIDDFGTGYSSLGYLKRFPVDSVKVDRSFVDGLGVDSEDSAIVAAVVSLGHALGLSVVAEGVETTCQLKALHALGCDRAQGYWFSGPRDPIEFAGLLHRQPWVEMTDARRAG